MITFKLRSARPEFATCLEPMLSLGGQRYTTQNGGYPYALKTALNGDMEFRCQPGNAWPPDYPGNPAIRSEVSQDGSLSYGVSWWMQWDFTFLPDNGIIDATQNIIGQIHGMDSLGFGPIFSINIEPGAILKIRTAEDRVTPLPPWKYVDRYEAVIEAGVPYRFTCQSVFGAALNGSINAWLNKVGDTAAQVLQLTGINYGYAADTAPYFKYGAYIKPDTATQAVTVRYRNMILPRLTAITP